MWILVLQLFMEAVKNVPELVTLFNDMLASNQTEPTDAQKQALADAYKARTGADFRWDSFTPIPGK